MSMIISEIMEWCQNDIDYLQELIDNLQDIVNNSQNEQVCLVCGKKKEEYESAYCDECWEKKKKD